MKEVLSLEQMEQVEQILLQGGRKLLTAESWPLARDAIKQIRVWAKRQVARRERSGRSTKEYEIKGESQHDAEFALDRRVDLRFAGGARLIFVVPSFLEEKDSRDD